MTDRTVQESMARSLAAKQVDMESIFYRNLRRRYPNAGVESIKELLADALKKKAHFGHCSGCRTRGKSNLHYSYKCRDCKGKHHVLAKHETRDTGSRGTTFPGIPASHVRKAMVQVARDVWEPENRKRGMPARQAMTRNFRNAQALTSGEAFTTQGEQRALAFASWFVTVRVLKRLGV